MSKVRTDNSYLADKIALRLSMLPRKKTLKVIDAFHGQGTIWKNIEKAYKGKIEITRIDVEEKTGDFVFLGDNIKFLSALPLEKYDVVDLDAYGVPYKQLKVLFNREFKGLVFVTFIQSVMGRLQDCFLEDLGYTKEMVKKCPALFSKNGHEKLLRWLGLHGVKSVIYRKKNRKTYLAFQV